MSAKDDEARAASRRRTAEALAAYKAVPESEKTPVRQRDKYSFPLGFDDDGNPFPDRGHDE